MNLAQNADFAIASGHFSRSEANVQLSMSGSLQIRRTEAWFGGWWLPNPSGWGYPLPFGND